MGSRFFDKWTKTLIVLAVVIIFGSIAYAYFSIRYRTIIAEQANMLEQVANDIERDFNGRLTALKVVAAAPDVRNLNMEKIDPELTSAMNALGLFGIALVDLDGNIIADPTGVQPKKVRDADSFVKVVKGQPVISDRIVPDTIDNAFISLRVPVYNTRDQVQAVIIAGVPLADIANLFWHPSPQDSHQYIYVIDGKGKIIYHPRFKELYPEKEDFLQRAKQKFISQQSGYIVARSALDNSKKLFVFTTVNNTDWRIVMSTPLTDIYALVLRASIPDLLIFCLLVTCFGLLLARLRQMRKYEELRENIRLERLKSVNQLAAGIAHEIRNPLTSIKGFIQLMLIKGDRPAPRYLEISLAEIERIEKLIKEFHLLARPLQEPRQEKIDVGNIVKDVVLLMESQALTKSVALELDANEPVWVSGDTAQLKQVWINLLRNAIEAVSKGGSIHISVSAQKNWACVTVQDNGSGIPEHVLAQIGTPFFTTKEGGTGLGLSVCYSIVQHHGGHIKVISKMGEGTTFTVLLPLVEDKP